MTLERGSIAETLYLIHVRETSELAQQLQTLTQDLIEAAEIIGRVQRDVQVMQGQSQAGTERLERALSTIEGVLAQDTLAKNLLDCLQTDLYGHLTAFTSRDREESAETLRKILREFAATAEQAIASQRDAALGKPVLPTFDPSAPPLEKVNAILLRAYIRFQRFCIEVQPVAIAGLCVTTAICAYRLWR